jgi:transcriptional regulator with XRE-family HTH domain
MKRLRKTHHLTLSQLAERTGMSQPYLSMLERGKRRNPSLATLKKLAKALKVPLGKLLK